jgi:hypothetical protein
MNDGYQHSPKHDEAYQSAEINSQLIAQKKPCRQGLNNN